MSKIEDDAIAAAEKWQKIAEEWEAEAAVYKMSSEIWKKLANENIKHTRDAQDLVHKCLDELREYRKMVTELLTKCPQQ